MSKPKLLDLFCGAIDILNRFCYNKVWVKLNVSIAVKRLKLLDRVARSFAHIVVRNVLLTIYQVPVTVKSVARSSLSIGETRIVGIVLRLVLRRHSQRKLCSGINSILMLWLRITRHVSQRIQVLIERSLALTGMRPSVYWGANV